MEIPVPFLPERVVIGIHQRTPPRVAVLGRQLQAIYDLPACEKFHKALLINLFQVLPGHQRKNAVYQGVDRGVGIEVPDRASASQSQFRLMAWIVPVSHLQRRIEALIGDRKSTRLNSSHVKISYA